MVTGMFDTSTDPRDAIEHVIDAMRRQMRSRDCEAASFFASEVSTDRWIEIMAGHYGTRFTPEHEIIVRYILRDEAKRDRIRNLH